MVLSVRRRGGGRTPLRTGRVEPKRERRGGGCTGSDPSVPESRSRHKFRSKVPWSLVYLSLHRTITQQRCTWSRPGTQVSRRRPWGTGHGRGPRSFVSFRRSGAPVPGPGLLLGVGRSTSHVHSEGVGATEGHLSASARTGGSRTLYRPQRGRTKGEVGRPDSWPPDDDGKRGRG